MTPGRPRCSKKNPTAGNVEADVGRYLEDVTGAVDKAIPASPSVVVQTESGGISGQLVRICRGEGSTLVVLTLLVDSRACAAFALHVVGENFQNRPVLTPQPIKLKVPKEKTAVDVSVHVSDLSTHVFLQPGKGGITDMAAFRTAFQVETKDLGQGEGQACSWVVLIDQLLCRCGIDPTVLST